MDSSTALKDGDYTPDSFSFSGGTGRLSISCQKITVSGGQAYATIAFSSGKIIYVKANGKQYAPVSQTGDTSTFQIPVTLNANTSILACTTAMSVPHEIEYTLFVGLEAAKTAKAASGSSIGQSAGDTTSIKAGTAASGTNSGKDGSGKKASNGLSGTKVTAVSSSAGSAVLAAGGSLTADEDNAPKVPGLEYEGSYSNEYAAFFRLHFYADEFEVLEINLSRKEEPDWPEEKPDGIIEANAGTDTAEGGEEAEEKSLYSGQVLRYLIAPEGKELPAGIDKEMIVITVPVRSAYVDSDNVMRMLEKLDAADAVSVSGAEAGHYDEDGAYTQMILKEADLAVFPAELLEAGADPAAEDKADSGVTGSGPDAEPDQDTAYLAFVQDTGDGMAVLKIPMVIDRSPDEAQEAGQYEWLIVYGALFGREAQAGAAFAQARDALEKTAVSAEEPGDSEKETEMMTDE